MIIEYPKGTKVDKTVRIDYELWEKFRKYVGGKGLKITFVMGEIVKKYLEEEKLKDKAEKSQV